MRHPPMTRARAAEARSRVLALLARKPDATAVEIQTAYGSSKLDPSFIPALRLALQMKIPDAHKYSLKRLRLRISRAASPNLTPLRAVSKSADMPALIRRLRELTPLLGDDVMKIEITPTQYKIHRRVVEIVEGRTSETREHGS